MANEGEMIVVGAILAFAGFLMIVSPVIDDMVILFIKITPISLQYIAFAMLFGGIAIAIVAIRSRKKSS